ncbi:MAG TPA: hypothetical protein VIC54_11600 [Terriglobales bacterium]
MPDVVAALLLQEMINYDWQFPAERQALDGQFAYLNTLDAGDFDRLLSGFDQLRSPRQIRHLNWVATPNVYMEDLAAQLWATGEFERFTALADRYVSAVRAARPAPPPPVPRLGIAIIGGGVTAYDGPLFEKARPYGTLFTNVNPEHGSAALVDAVAARAEAHPAPYAHWYIEGGLPADTPSGVSCLAYGSLTAPRSALLRKMDATVKSGGAGPEALRTLMAQMQPADIGIDFAGDAILNHFALAVLTLGSGTQIYSTTFVQWAARESLRRAQPWTVLLRFTPRQRQESLDELLSPSPHPELDPQGSLVDADMGAYYTWLNQQRLPGADQSAFLVWFEGHRRALAIGPSMARGTESPSPCNIKQLLKILTE